MEGESVSRLDGVYANGSEGGNFVVQSIPNSDSMEARIEGGTGGASMASDLGMSSAFLSILLAGTSTRVEA